MSKARTEELRLVAEQAAELLNESASTQKEQEERLNWLMESSLHVREALAARALQEEVRNLDRDRRIDADALIAKALKGAIPLSGSEPP